MKARIWMCKQNKGFSLIELLVAITILALLTVPLLNSFVMSGKINRNSRRLQNATAVAQSSVEAAKHTTDMAELEAVLKTMPDSSGFVSLGTSGLPAYSMDVKGADGERFRLNIRLTPKPDYDYKDTAFADLYNEAGVIYSELVLYDNSVLTLMRNQAIPYDSADAPDAFKWNETSGGWEAWTPAADDKALRYTYGNLFADEYTSGDIEGIINPDFSDMYGYFKKENMDKMVDVDIAQYGDDYKVTINTAYSIDYDVIYRGEDDAAETGDGDTAMAFYRYKGRMVYEADEITLTYSTKIPLYLLYVKSEGAKYDEAGMMVRAADPRHFNSTVYNISIDGAVFLTNEDGTARNVELYLVEQAGARNDDGFRININNNSYNSALDIYTTEVFNNAPATDSIVKAAEGKGITVYSDKDVLNEDNHVGYKKGEGITSLYKIDVEVYYDEPGDGSYSQLVYSVSTED